jgi:hypothetical protein
MAFENNVEKGENDNQNLGDAVQTHAKRASFTGLPVILSLSSHAAKK